MRLCYVRFGAKDGAFPDGERSKNSLTGEYELGVSVYQAIEIDGKYQILLPKIDPQAIATIGMCFNVAQGLWGQTENPLYEVDGTFIGIGSDGEPLLRDCRAVKRIFDLEYVEQQWKERETDDDRQVVFVTEDTK